MNAHGDSQRIAVVGAGIIGLSVALRLAMEGFSVRVIDRDAPMQGCSYGNAGYLTQSNIFPPLSKSILKNLPRLLLDPNSPLVIRSPYLKTFASWGWRAAKELSPLRASAIRADLSSISRRAITDFDPLLDAAGARDLVSREGSLVVFRTGRALQNLVRSVEIWRSNGIAAEAINSKTVHEMEPALTSDLVGAIHFPNAGRCLDPEALGLRYAANLAALGMKITRDEVRHVSNTRDGVRLETANGSFLANKVVICAGYFSKELLRPFSVDVPLASERGYHYMLPVPGVKLNRPIVFGEPYFAATPMRDGLRLAGTAEFSWPDVQPNMRRAKHLYKVASAYIPGLCATGSTCWMGVRPSLPDGKPAIGRLKEQPDVFYAFGHGHSGLTYSATTAQCIRDLLLGKEPPIQMSAFSIDRFNT